MPVPRLRLRGRDLRRYYAPTLICGYLVALCAALIVTALFLPGREQLLATVAAGVFGIAVSGALGAFFWFRQRRALEYRILVTGRSAAANFARARAAALEFGWRLGGEERDRWLEARTPSTPFADGELVVVEFRGGEMLLGSLPDLDAGFSRQALKRARAHCERLAAALCAHAAPGSAADQMLKVPSHQPTT